MKLVTELLEIDVYGINTKMRYPTMSELSNFGKKVQEATGDETVKEFLMFLGMTEEAFNKLTARDISKVTEALAGK